LRVDSDVLEWFRAQGKGHLTRMNAVLRSYVAAQKHGPQSGRPIMTTWHYRFLRYTDGTLALHEVYCDEEGRPNGYTTRPISFAVDADEGHDGLVQSMKMALRDAVERPILDVPDLPE